MGSTIKRAVVLSIISFVLGGVLNTAAADIEANKDIYRRTNREAWSQGQLAVIDEVVAPAYLYHEPALGEISGREGLKQTIMAYRAAYPDLNFTIEELIAEGDLVAMRWTAAGTHQGELMGIPATGLATTSVGINIARFDTEGRIVEEWSGWDVLGLMQQLGAVQPARAGDDPYVWDEPSQIAGDPGTPDENKLLVLRVKTQFWNGKEIAALDETHHATAIGHDPTIPGEASYESYKASCLAYQIAFPDLHQTTDAIFAEGDKVVVRWTGRGTHRGDLMGIPASGNSVKFSGVTIYRIADGRIAESWWAYDAMGLMQQLTAAPEWPPQGTWIVTVPSPMGDLTFLHVIAPADSSGRHSGVLWQVNANPTFFGTFPDFTGGAQFWATETVRTAPNTYETGMVVYNTLPVEGLLEQIGSIGVANVTWTITGPDTNEGEAILSTYLADQDADGDGLPDEGQEPTICTPFPFTSKRFKTMPACVPTVTE
jgi:steroid delta-isomerase-like uncharacterized protein